MTTATILMERLATLDAEHATALVLADPIAHKLAALAEHVPAHELDGHLETIAMGLADSYDRVTKVRRVKHGAVVVLHVGDDPALPEDCTHYFMCREIHCDSTLAHGKDGRFASYRLRAGSLGEMVALIRATLATKTKRPDRP